MKELIKKYYPLALIVIFAILYLENCNRSAKEKTEIKKAWAYKSMMYENNEATLKRDTTEKGEELIMQKQLLVTEKQAHELDVIENKRLKKINSEVRVITVTKINDVFVNVTDTVIVEKGDTIREAKSFNEVNKWYGLKGYTSPKGIMFSSIYFNNELVITIGYEKKKGIKNLFKKSEPVVDVVNKSPYSRTDELYNVVIKPSKKKFYQTTGFKIGLGVASGFWLHSKLTP